MLATNIPTRMKMIANLRNEDIIFVESYGVKYKEGIIFICFGNTMKNIPLFLQSKWVRLISFWKWRTHN